MSAAIIGLVGVVVGALVTALGSVWVERRRDMRATASAERDIKSALDVSQLQLETALEKKVWWPASSPLPLKTWSDQASKLSSDLPVADRKRLDDAFGVLYVLNKIADSERPKSGPAPALTEDKVDKVRQRLGNVTEAIDVLKNRESARRRTRIIAITAISAIALVLVAVGVFAGVQSLTGPPSVTASSLASALQRTTHVDFASCEQDAAVSTADWQCSLADFSGSGCSSGLLSAPASQVSSIEFTRALSTDCAVVGESAVDVEVNEDSCFLWEMLDKFPVASQDHQPPRNKVAPGQPPSALTTSTGSGCI